MKKENINRAIKYIHSWIEYNFPFSRAAGFVVAIGQCDKLLWQKACGMANMEKKIKMRTDYFFRIASHSKMFTAVALMQLVEKKKIKLNDPLNKYLPWLAETKDKRYRRITIRHILEHAAGIIRDGEDGSYWTFERPFPKKKDLIKILKSTKLVYRPNRRFKYSNVGFSLLGLLIEEVSGLSYSEYLEKNIFGPLGMRNSGADVSPDVKFSRFAVGYGRVNIKLLRKHLKNSSTNAMAPATGVYATAADLCKFTRIFYQKTPILSEKSKCDITRMHWIIDKNNKDYQYGLGCSRQKIGPKYYVGHTGGYPGFITRTLIDVDNKITLVFLRNSLDGPWIVNGIIKILQFFEKIKFTSSARKFDEYQGRFEDIWSTLDIINGGDRLIGVYPDNWGAPENNDELQRIGKDKFVLEKVRSSGPLGETVKFIRSHGKIIAINYAGTIVPRVRL